ncbi:MAG: translation initiation factor IF-2 subunit alpha, partial [Metallosphaera sp.]
VNDDDRKKKNAQWKRVQKLDKILEIASQKLKRQEKEAWEQVAWKLEEKYGDAFEALQKASKEGENVLLEAGVPEIWIKPVLEEASKHGEEKKVKESKVVLLRTTDPNGIEKIKKVFDLDEEETKIFTIGAPRYRVEVSGTDVKAVAQKLEEVVQKILERAKNEGISAEVAK